MPEQPEPMQPSIYGPMPGEPEPMPPSIYGPMPGEPEPMQPSIYGPMPEEPEPMPVAKYGPMPEQPEPMPVAKYGPMPEQPEPMPVAKYGPMPEDPEPMPVAKYGPMPEEPETMPPSIYGPMPEQPEAVPEGQGSIPQSKPIPQEEAEASLEIGSAAEDKPVPSVKKEITDIKDTHNFIDELDGVIKDIKKFTENSGYVTGEFGKAISYSSESLDSELTSLNNFAEKNVLKAMDYTGEYDYNMENINKMLEPVESKFGKVSFSPDGTIVFDGVELDDSSKAIVASAEKLYKDNISLKNKINNLANERIPVANAN